MRVLCRLVQTRPARGDRRLLPTCFFGEQFEAAAVSAHGLRTGNHRNFQKQVVDGMLGALLWSRGAGLGVVGEQRSVFGSAAQ